MRIEAESMKIGDLIIRNILGTDFLKAPTTYKVYARAM